MKTTGTITRSSKYLCEKMVAPVDFKNAKIIVELGAGDGVVTKVILDRMEKNTKLYSFEVNPEFCTYLSKITDPRFQLISDSAENLEQYLKEYKIEEIDYVISAIPFVVIPDDITANILSECNKFLKIGGKFIQIHYSLLKKKMYSKTFSNVKLKFVALNIPPAWVFTCVKK